MTGLSPAAVQGYINEYPHYFAQSPAVPGEEPRYGWTAVERPAQKPPVWDVLAERAAAIPESELAKLPPDLAENLDHYLYGTPTRR